MLVEALKGWPAGAKFMMNEQVEIIDGELAGKRGTVLGCYRSGTQWIYTLELDGTTGILTELSLSTLTRPVGRNYQ